ncbi:MAG: fluoride efflux transporter CrcB [Sorangiineae bacterium]|nr:fluoride efflux transporter CrcB [Polyangiaceae bacterium]MEB2324112.1 fluoride efflux transporter CrcB [Sorangiineae bacterium]
MERLAWVCLGGALGSGTRYLVATWAGRTLESAFPFGTFIVNVAGSFLLMVVLELALSTELVGPNLRLALTTGFMGGLTTYSTFNYETLTLLRERAWLLAIGNVAFTLVSCLAAGVAGMTLVRRLVSH